jgi:hypothetical protein
MAQTGISTEESSEPTSSLKPSEGLAKDGPDSQRYPDPELPAPTPSESGPSGARPAERSSERKQPARASKRDIVFVRRNQRMCVSVLSLSPPCSPTPISRATARETKSKLHLVRDGPQLPRQQSGNANGRPREHVIREVSKGLPIVPRRESA